jgi:hypothetical protein
MRQARGCLWNVARPTDSREKAGASENDHDICDIPVAALTKVENSGNFIRRCKSHIYFSAPVMLCVGSYWTSFPTCFAQSRPGVYLEQLRVNGDIGRAFPTLSICLVTIIHQSRELNRISLFLPTHSCRKDFANSASQPYIKFRLLALSIFPFLRPHSLPAFNHAIPKSSRL